MKSSVWLFAAAMSVSALALAQNAPKAGVTESTDPAKIAEIEQHAQQLAASQSATPATGEHEHMRKHGMRHHKHKAQHKREMKDQPAPDAPVASDSKG